MYIPERFLYDLYKIKDVGYKVWIICCVYFDNYFDQRIMFVRFSHEIKLMYI